MSTIDKIIEIPVEITVNTPSDIQKRLVYIYGYNMSNFDTFKEGLVRQHRLVQVEEA